MNDQQNQNRELFPLDFYAGDFPTRPVLVDAGCETEAARLRPRMDVPNVGVAECDSGSFEFQP